MSDLKPLNLTINDRIIGRVPVKILLSISGCQLLKYFVVIFLFLVNILFSIFFSEGFILSFPVSMCLSVMIVGNIRNVPMLFSFEEKTN